MKQSSTYTTGMKNSKVIPLPTGQEPYTPILAGPPETNCLKSGFVILAPGKSVGKHSTKEYEELIVPLEGEGELRVDGMEPLPIRKGQVLYTPPQTPHDVLNTSNRPLKYIYIVAKPR
jgi:mannose-6-phosphate isomerase-like protein (cupin superfamily)